VATIGAFIIAVGVLVFILAAIASFRRPRTGEADPWDARTLEWTTTSPPPEYNFEEIPVVHHLDEFWHRKYAEDDTGRVVRVAASEDVAQKGDATNVHLPAPSYWPIVLAAGLPLIGYGLIFNLGFAAVGGAIVLLAAYGWGLEPADDPEAAHGHDGHVEGWEGTVADAEAEAAEAAADADPDTAAADAAGPTGDPVVAAAEEETKE
jgi:cytochrome c oxidase subunit I